MLGALKVVVEHDAPVEPSGVGVRSCHYEHMSDILLLGLSSLSIPHRESFEMINAIETDKFGVYQYGDVRGLFNVPNQVFRHCISTLCQ